MTKERSYNRIINWRDLERVKMEDEEFHEGEIEKLTEEIKKLKEEIKGLKIKNYDDDTRIWTD